jgi:hypothetical protein
MGVNRLDRNTLSQAEEAQDCDDDHDHANDVEDATHTALHDLFCGRATPRSFTMSLNYLLNG